MLKIHPKNKDNSLKCIKCKKIGKFYCKSCQHVYCQDCGTSHITSFKDHNINNIDDKENKNLPKIESKVKPIELKFNKINKKYKYNASEENPTFDNHYYPSLTEPNDKKQEEEKKISDIYKKKEKEIKEKFKK